MSRHSFVIYGRLSGLNEITKANRGNRYAGAALKKKDMKLCADYVMVGGLPNFKTPIMLDISWFEPNSRRDIDNISGGGTKAILDSLVEAGKLPNDGRKWVKSITHYFPEPDKKNPRIVVEIVTVESDEPKN